MRKIIYGGPIERDDDDAGCTPDEAAVEPVAPDELKARIDGGEDEHVLAVRSEDAVREAASRLFDSLDQLTDRDDGTVVLPGHFSDETVRPLATGLGELRAESSNELLSYVADGGERAFVESLADEPANYSEIKQINRGREQPDGDVESLELGPNNCAVN